MNVLYYSSYNLYFIFVHLNIKDLVVFYTHFMMLLPSMKIQLMQMQWCQQS